MPVASGPLTTEQIAEAEQKAREQVINAIQSCTGGGYVHRQWNCHAVLTALTQYGDFREAKGAWEAWWYSTATAPERYTEAEARLRAEIDAVMGDTPNEARMRG